jgi:putative ABC transport system permease protein
MAPPRTWLSTLYTIVTRRPFEDGMSEELRFHVEAYADDLMRSGLPRDEALRQARLALGNHESLKEDLRAARGQRVFDELTQDLRYARRRFRRSRGPAIVAVLALGVGVNLAVFSVIQAALLRPLPHPHPDRLVAVSSRNIENGREHQTSPQDFFDFERRATTFEHLAAYYPPGFTITGDGQAERVSGARASSGIFAVFGVTPALGRGFGPDEDRAGAPPVAVISHDVWMRRYHSDPSAVGQAITLSGRVYTVVGVLPAGFQSPALWPRTPDVWVPIGLDPNVGRRDARMMRVIGRLKPGVSIEQARAELDAMATSLGAEYPATNAKTGVTTTSLHEQLTRDVQPSLYALAAAVIALLLVACGNAAGLLVGHAFERQHEFAIRLAIGASRTRLIRQIVAESVPVGLLAAGAGFALALYAKDVLIGAATAAGVPRASEIHIGWPTFFIGVALSLACTIACALFAAFTLTRMRDLRVVRGAGAATPQRSRARAIVIAVEAAFSLALLAGAGLLVRSFYELQVTQPGFDSEHVFTARLSPPQARYPAGPVLSAFYDRVLERVRALPGVESASVVDWLPVSGFGAAVPFTVPRTTPSTMGATLAELRVIDADYFQTLGVPIVSGRAFDRRDVEGAPPAIIVNEAFARAYVDSRSPVGELVTLDRGSPLRVEIVGVVGEVREIALRIPASPTIYAPKAQQPWMRYETRDLVVRSHSDVASLAPAIHTVLRELEPDLPRPSVFPMSDVIGQSLTRPGFYASAVASFAIVAALLAAFGIYGTVASAVTERRLEIGIRLALGASRARVLLRAAQYGALPTFAGLLVGVPLALGAGRLLRQQLYGIEPADVGTLLIVCAIMSSVALAAALVPALRAARIDPASTLRHEDGR